MTLEIAAILGLLILAVYLFATEKLPVDIITLLALCILSGARILTPAEAFAGFSNEILIMLGAIFVLGGALQNNGVPNLLAAKLMKLTGSHPRRLLAGLMLASASASAFMNNTTVAALFVPPTTGLARKTGVSASKLLMPLAFSAILGGTCTLIGTSTNIAVSGYLKQAGYQSLGMFEVLPMGLIMVALGIGYMVFAGWKMLPEHETDTLSEPEEMRNYLAEVLVLPGSPLAGTKAIKPGLSNFRIVAIQNGGSQVIPDSRSVIKEGDRLIVNGVVDELRKITKTEGLRFCSKLDLEDLETDTPGSETEIVEAIILPGGELVGTCLSEIRFKQRYGLTVLAIHRNGESQMENLAEGIIKTGDVLLLFGAQRRARELQRRSSRLRILGNEDSIESVSVISRNAWKSIGIFFVSILVGTTGLLPLSVAFLSGAVLAILTGCITAEKAREFIDWRLLILIGGMTAFGTAMEKTGAAELLAGWVISVLAPLGVAAVLAGFLVLTILLTQPMSNAAAALVILPVGLSAAKTIGADPRTFAIGIMLAASVSFITPLEPACLLVTSAGKYRMIDFIRIGGLLTVLLTIAILIFLPLFWNLQ